MGHALNHNPYFRLGPGRMPTAGARLPERTCQESLSVRVPGGLIGIFVLAFLFCPHSHLSQDSAINAKSRLEELIRLCFSDVKALPEGSSRDGVDDAGQKCQLVTWREQLGFDTYRVVVSQHRMHGLGTSSLQSARGFTIGSSGRIELLAREEAERLFL